MEEKRPAQRVYVTVGHREFLVVATDKLSMPELREAKRISGMPLADMEVAFAKADPDAWTAMLYVSIRRVEPTLTVEDLDRMFGDTPLMAIVETIRDETPEVAVPDPLASTSTNDNNDQKNELDSGEKILPVSTPVTSGSPPF